MTFRSKLFKNILELSKSVKHVQIRNKIFLAYSPNAELSKSIINKYSKLKRPGKKCPATYVWIDGSGAGLRSKIRTLDFKPKCVEDLPQWSFDGSSTGLADLNDSDVIMRPVAMYKDPFYLGGVIALCDTYRSNGEPTATNKRLCCIDALDQICEMKPWFGFEQELILMNMYKRGFPFLPSAYTRPPGRFYCGVGAKRAFGRPILDAIYYCLLYMDLAIGGTNAEVMPGQWEYQIGPGAGIDAADELWISRYVMQRVSEEYGVHITLDPKPMKDWPGSGLHCNFSTECMRADDGIKEMEKAIEKLKTKHARHIAAYDPKKGADNRRRLTGTHSTAIIQEFSSGVASRSVSVRIPRTVAEAKKGWLEDRRPSANADPYSVINVIVRTCFLNQ